MIFTRGMRDKISKYADPSSEIIVEMSINGKSVYDFCCFGVDKSEKLSDDRYMIFYNQTSSPQGEIRYQAGSNSASFAIRLSSLPESIDKLVFTASIDGNGIMGDIIQHKLIISQKGAEKITIDLKGSDFRQEKAIISAEIYRKGEWRINAIASGFNGGLPVLLRKYGGEECNSSTAQPVPQQPISASSQQVSIPPANSAPRSISRPPIRSATQQVSRPPIRSVPQPVQSQPFGAVPQPVQSQPFGAVPQPVQSQPFGAVPQPVQPQPFGSIPQPFQSQPFGSVPQPVQSQPFGSVPQPVQSQPIRTNPQQNFSNQGQFSHQGVVLRKNEEELTQELMGKITLSKDKVNLEKHVVNLSKCMVNLSKKSGVDLGSTRAKVVVVLDYSGSMSSLYSNGTVQRTLNRLVPLGLTFDDNGSIDVFLFSNSYKKLNDLNISNYENYVNSIVRNSMMSMGGTSYAPVLRAIIEGGTIQTGFLFLKTEYTPPIVDNGDPTFILFITDGENSDRSASDTIIQKASSMNLFIQFIGIGNERFQYLEKLDDLPGRVRDNTGFSKMKSLDNASDQELYTNVLDQFSKWLRGLQ